MRIHTTTKLQTRATGTCRGRIRGIGKNTTKAAKAYAQIVSKFPDFAATVQVGEDRPSGKGSKSYLKVYGIGKKRLRRVQRSIEQATGIEFVEIFKSRHELSDFDDYGLGKIYVELKRKMRDFRWLTSQGCIFERNVSGKHIGTNEIPIIALLISEEDLKAKGGSATESLEDLRSSIHYNLHLTPEIKMAGELNRALNKTVSGLNLPNTEVEILEKEECTGKHPKFNGSTSYIKLTVLESDLTSEVTRQFAPRSKDTKNEDGNKVLLEISGSILETLKKEVSKLTGFPITLIKIDITDVKLKQQAQGLKLKLTPVKPHDISTNGRPTIELKPTSVRPVVCEGVSKTIPEMRRQRNSERLSRSTCKIRDFVCGTDDRARIGFDTTGHSVSLTINPTHYEALKIKVEASLGGRPVVNPKAKDKDEQEAKLEKFEVKFREAFISVLKAELRVAVKYLHKVTPPGYRTEVHSPDYTVRYGEEYDSTTKGLKPKLTFVPVKSKDAAIRRKTTTKSIEELTRGIEVEEIRGSQVSEDAVRDAFEDDETAENLTEEPIDAAYAIA